MTKVRNGIAAWGTVLALLMTGAVLTGCRTQQTTAFAEIPGISPQTSPAAAASAPEPSAPVSATAAEKSVSAARSSEVLNPGDTIRIEYNDLPVVTPPFLGPIKEDGTITLILNQKFTAAGKTRGELEKEIRDRYVPSLYKFLTVTVSPVNDTRYYYVGGEVRAPGRQMYLSRMTVLKAIQTAGDFTDFARKGKVKLTRADGKRVDTIDCVKALQNPKLDLEVYPGDTIHVPRRFW
jgi:protein involved in polysaccharide export with SLBB domain